MSTSFILRTVLFCTTMHAHFLNDQFQFAHHILLSTSFYHNNVCDFYIPQSNLENAVKALAKNRTTAIDAPGGNTSYTYRGPDQAKRVQVNSTRYVYSLLAPAVVAASYLTR
ncbi:MAG TPA: hypothetical protein VKV20_03450 [Ktedonobacteraceae bacterium]|nr:hypothetical protein [Ktedonobacteraceae bacterium]